MLIESIPKVSIFSPMLLVTVGNRKCLTRNRIVCLMPERDKMIVERCLKEWGVESRPLEGGGQGFLKHIARYAQGTGCGVVGEYLY